MCILCVVSRWSRRIVTMLPWLIFPLIILWALSQLLPPSFRFEVTSPRLACLAVLLISLGWYEVAMPRFSSWRARRSALMREMKRIEAQEAAKWRKEATRRCRNCLTAYKDQAPAGGRFMCTYCGHVSKRPVLEVPGTFPRSSGPGMTGNIAPGGVPLSRAYSAGRLVNGGGVQSCRGPWGGSRAGVGRWPWATEGGGCANGAWFGSSRPVGAGSQVAGDGGLRGARASLGESIYGGDKCAAGESYSGFLLFVLKVLSYIVVGLSWVWRKLLGIGQSGKESVSGGSRASQRRGEDGGSLHGSRGEKARRKAKEKRQARLEKELLELEERKQREEVARLVEERRRQRDEKLEAEMESEREAAAEREREIRRERETERRRKEKVREREKELAKDRLKEQEPEEVQMKKGNQNEKATSIERKDKNHNPKLTMVNGVESWKGAKVSRGHMHEAGSRLRGVTENAMKSGFSRYIGSTKGGTLSSSKNVGAHVNNPTSFWGRNISAGSNSRGKFGKTATALVSSSSNLSAKSDGGVAQLSGSAWKRIPWTKVWGKGTEAMTEDTPRMQPGIVDGSSQRLDQNNEGGVKHLANRSSVVRLSSSTVGAPAIQPPIAPPSSHIKSWHHLFSSPSIFPPIDLPVDVQNQPVHKQQTEIGSKNPTIQTISSSVPPGHTFFEIPSSASFQSSESSSMQVPLSLSTSLPMSTPVQTSASSPLLPTLSGSLNMNELSCMDIHNPISVLRPVSNSLLRTSFPVDLGTSVSSGITSNPVSPISVPVSDPMCVTTSILSPISKPSKPYETDLHSGKDELLPWCLPSLSLDDSNDTMNEGRWQMWDAPQLHEIKVSESSTWILPPNDGLLEQELQPLQLNSVQSPFDLETQLPSRLSCPQQKQDSPNQNSDEFSGAEPVSSRRSFWSNFSAFESTMRIWEDPDKIPPEFVDCITQEIMEDPVITADGHSYERAAIETWLKSHDTSPKTGEVLPPPPGGNGTGVDKTLRPNHILRGQIIEFKERIARGSESKGMADNGWSIFGSSSPWSTTSLTSPHIGGVHTTPGMQSVWSF